MSAIGRELSVEVFVEIGEDPRAGVSTILEFGSHEDEGTVQDKVRTISGMLLNALPRERIEHMNASGNAKDESEQAEFLSFMREQTKALRLLTRGGKRKPR